MSRLDFERVYPHPRAKLWRALTDADLLGRWLMPNDFEPRVGHRFTFRTEPGPGFDGIVHCEVLRLDEPEVLSFTWRGGPLDTVVTFRLDEVDGGTRLRFEQTGFRGVKAWLVRAILKAGFRNMYGRKLPRVLDGLDAGPGRAACPERRTGVRVALLRILGRKHDA